MTRRRKPGGPAPRKRTRGRLAGALAAATVAACAAWDASSRDEASLPLPTVPAPAHFPHGHVLATATASSPPSSRPAPALEAVAPVAPSVPDFAPKTVSSTSGADPDPAGPATRPPTFPVHGVPGRDSSAEAATPATAPVSSPPATVPEPVSRAAAPSAVEAESAHGLAATATNGPAQTIAVPLGQSHPWLLDHQAEAVFVADPSIANVQLLSPDVLYIIGSGLGRTSVAVLDVDGQLHEWLVTTVLDLDPMRALLASDPATNRVQVQQFSRGVTLTGDVASVAAAERVQRLVAAALPANTAVDNSIHVTAPQQVSLEVQIAEVQRSVSESLGFRWEAFNQVGGGDLLWRIGRPAFLSPATGIDALAGLAPEFVEGQPTSSIAARDFGSKGAVQGVIDALAGAGLANVLARPNLTAMSGETASFFSGGEYPLPSGFRDGVIVFSYKKYGVLLDFVPTVVDPDRITLTVRPEVSETSSNEALVTVGTEIPVINVRRAETTVEIGNGESIVIAGLFRTGSNMVESGLTGMKDLPVLGPLFRRQRVEASETELIVVVTANLVRTGAVRTDQPAPTTRQLHGYHY